MMYFRPFMMILLLGLAACAGPALISQNGPAVEYLQPGTPGGRMCTSQCKNAASHCNDACKYRERLCAYDVQSQAIKDYENYVQEQFAERQEVELRPRDFERMDQCIQTSCTSICQRSYDRCFTKCGGKITREPQ